MIGLPAVLRFSNHPVAGGDPVSDCLGLRLVFEPITRMPEVGVAWAEFPQGSNPPVRYNATEVKERSDTQSFSVSSALETAGGKASLGALPTGESVSLGIAFLPSSEFDWDGTSRFYTALTVRVTGFSGSYDYTNQFSVPLNSGYNPGGGYYYANVGIVASLVEDLSQGFPNYIDVLGSVTSQLNAPIAHNQVVSLSTPSFSTSPWPAFGYNYLVSDLTNHFAVAYEIRNGFDKSNGANLGDTYYIEGSYSSTVGVTIGILYRWVGSMPMFRTLLREYNVGYDLAGNQVGDSGSNYGITNNFIFTASLPYFTGRSISGQLSYQLNPSLCASISYGAIRLCLFVMPDSTFPYEFAPDPFALPEFSFRVSLVNGAGDVIDSVVVDQTTIGYPVDIYDGNGIKVVTAMDPTVPNVVLTFA